MIRRRGKKWIVEVYNPATRTKRYIGSFDKRGSIDDPGTAKYAEREAESEFRKRGRAKIGTVEGWAQRWLEEFPRPEKTTAAHHEGNLKLFLAEFGDRRLDRITKAEANRIAQTRPHVARTVSAMYNDAIRYLEGYDAGNPFARLVTQGKGRQDITPLSENEVKRLGEIALEVHGLLFGATFRAVILFAAWTGCRPGELAGLRWSDLDFKEMLIRVERQRRADGLARTKTKMTREVVMAQEAADAVRSMPVRDREWLFTTPQGKPFSKGNFGYYWRAVRSVFESELPRTHWLPRRLELDPKDHLDLMECRHFFGSMLADQGLTARDISAQMGNSPEVCERVYVHLHVDRSRERVREALARAGRATASPPPVAQRSDGGGDTVRPQIFEETA